MTKRQTRTRRGLRYQALAEGYKLLKPEVAKSYQLAADHYDRSDPPLDLVADADKRGKQDRPELTASPVLASTPPIAAFAMIDGEAVQRNGSARRVARAVRAR
jgi:hypothetical protein